MLLLRLLLPTRARFSAVLHLSLSSPPPFLCLTLIHTNKGPRGPCGIRAIRSGGGGSRQGVGRW